MVEMKTPKKQISIRDPNQNQNETQQEKLVLRSAQNHHNLKKEKAHKNWIKVNLKIAKLKPLTFI